MATGRQPWFIYGDAEESNGIEVDFSYNPVQNWQMMIGYAHATKAETVESTNPARLGLPLAAYPEDVLTLWTKYDVQSGALKGWSFGGGIHDSLFRHLHRRPQPHGQNAGLHDRRRCWCSITSSSARRTQRPS